MTVLAFFRCHFIHLRSVLFLCRKIWMGYNGNMTNQYARFQMLIGAEALQTLQNKRVAVFGIGGVGGYVVEALARSGIGTLDLIDHDDVSLTNLNRQIFALHSTLGKLKCDVAKDRVHDIDPSITVNCYPTFYLPEKRDDFPFAKWDYIVDAIDTVSAKIDIILAAGDNDIPIISSMGCGNRMDPSKLVYTDLFKTKNDPLARVMRRELKKKGITKLPVVYSEELPIKAKEESGEEIPEGKRSIPGSSAFVPSAAGILIAAKVVEGLLEKGM